MRLCVWIRRRVEFRFQVVNDKSHGANCSPFYEQMDEK